MADEEDFLDELIAERTKNNPDFPKLVEAALRRRQEARARGEDPNDVDEAEAAEEAEVQPATSAPNAQP